MQKSLNKKKGTPMLTSSSHCATNSGNGNETRSLSAKSTSKTPSRAFGNFRRTMEQWKWTHEKCNIEISSRIHELSKSSPHLDKLVNQVRQCQCPNGYPCGNRFACTSCSRRLAYQSLKNHQENYQKDLSYFGRAKILSFVLGMPIAGFLDAMVISNVVKNGLVKSLKNRNAKGTLDDLIGILGAKEFAKAKTGLQSEFEIKETESAKDIYGFNPLTYVHFHLSIAIREDSTLSNEDVHDLLASIWKNQLEVQGLKFEEKLVWHREALREELFDEVDEQMKYFSSGSLKHIHKRYRPDLFEYYAQTTILSKEFGIRKFGYWGFYVSLGGSKDEEVLREKNEVLEIVAKDEDGSPGLEKPILVEDEDRHHRFLAFEGSKERSRLPSWACIPLGFNHFYLVCLSLASISVKRSLRSLLWPP